MSTIDHIAQVDKRIATQYREATTLISYIKTLLSESNELEKVFCDLIDLRYIDTATGFTLDIIGAIVGQPRGFIPDNILPQFSYTNQANESLPLSGSFGTSTDANQGAVYASSNPTLGDPVVIDDSLYRVFIRARIAKNNTSSTREEVISQAISITGVSSVTVNELSDAEYDMTFAPDLSDDGKVLITFTDLLPKPVGVKANYFES